MAYAMTPLLNPLRPNSGRRHVRWHQLHGSATALALAECMHNDSRLYVVVTAGAREMERLAAEIAFFQGGKQATQALMPLPDWEILPYDLFSPPPGHHLAAAADPVRAAGRARGLPDTRGRTRCCSVYPRWPSCGDGRLTCQWDRR